MDDHGKKKMAMKTLKEGKKEKEKGKRSVHINKSTELKPGEIRSTRHTETVLLQTQHFTLMYRVNVCIMSHPAISRG